MNGLPIKSLITSICFISCLSAATAYADTHSYPATMCTAWSGAESLQYHYNGKLSNTSTTKDAWVVCPITLQTRKTIDAQVRTIDRHYSSDISCTLKSLRYYNPVNSNSRSSKANTSGSSDKIQTLNFNPVAGFSDGSFFLYCKIPPKYNGNGSYIINYHASEK